MCFLNRYGTAVLCLLAFYPCFLFAENVSLNLFVDGVEAFDGKLYEKALEKFEAAIKEEPLNLEYRYYSALVYSQMGKYPEALGIFEAIIQKAPEKYYKAFFDAAAVCSKLKDDKKALSFLESAEWQKPFDARIYLEKGYIYQKLKKFRIASTCFNRAAELDPSLKQVVYYNIGSLFLAAGEYENAEFMFLNAGVVNKKSTFAKHASDAAKSAKRAKKNARPLHASVYLGIGFDDNIACATTNEAGIRNPETTDNSDFYYTTVLNADYHLPVTGAMGISAGYIYNNFLYNNSGYENITGHLSYLMFNYDTGSIQNRFRYDFGIYYAGGDKRAKSQSGLYTIAVDDTKMFRSEVNINYANRNYFDDGLTPDSYMLGGEFLQFLRVIGGRLVLRGGCQYGFEKADSSYSSYSMQSLLLGTLMSFKNRAFFDLMVKGTSKSYDKYFGTGERVDEEFIIAPTFAFILNDYLELRVVGQSTWNRSNVVDNTDPENTFDPYRFRKNVVSCVLGYKI
jgi:Tfp pilus assembly protein PilF